MPAFYTHKRFGEEVIATLPPAFLENIQKYKEAFDLGTQGPDILFYHRPLQKNPIKTKGMQIHHTAAEDFFLRQGKQLLAENGIVEKNGQYLPFGAYAAYIAGFICHFTLDVSAHPHVYEKEATGIAHGRIESELDKYLLRKNELPIRGYNTAGSITIKNGTLEACAKTLEVSKTQAKRAIKTIRFINGLFSHKSEAFHALAHGVLKIMGMDHKFGEMFLHKENESTCITWNEVLYQDYLTAIPKAAAFIQEYFSQLPTIVKNGTMHVFFRNNYTGGTL